MIALIARDLRRGLSGLIAEHRAGGGAVLAASHVSLAGDWSRLRLGE